ncbi:MAG TPA: hypothetical protein DCM05_15530 [Elusimicrobia bacterium]|nr:hypothetical protein [Elusimicrobiota bacterium]
MNLKILTLSWILAGTAQAASLPTNVVTFHSDNDIEGGCKNIDYTDCVNRFLDNPTPGVDGLMLSNRESDSELSALISKAHSLGLSVGSGVDSWTLEEQVRDVERLAKLGFDWIEADELNVRGLQTAEGFNKMKDAAKKINSDILVGETENPTSAIAKSLGEGARPDFILNEVYQDTPGEITEMAALSKQYGIPAGTWLDDSGVGGHSLRFACDVHNSGLSVFYFNAGGYADKVGSLDTCGGAAAQPTLLSAIPEVGAGTAACPGSDAASCQAYLIMTMLQRQALGIPAVPDTMTAYPGIFGDAGAQNEGGPIFSAQPQLPAAALPAPSEQAMNDWLAALQAMFKAMFEAFQQMALALWGAPQTQAETNG